MDVRKHVFPLPLDLNYAASKTSTTVHTALNPYDLREGAIGIYGVHDSSTNPRKLCLIADGGSESAGVIPAASFNGDKVFVAIGVSTANGGCIQSNPLEVANLKCFSRAYAAATRQVYQVGYHLDDASSGSLNAPSTIINGDEASIGINDGSIEENKMVGKSYSAYASKDDDDVYDILVRLKAEIDDDDDATVTVDISGTDGAAPTYLSGSQDITTVQGSVNVTFAADPTTGWEVGKFVTIRGQVYKIAVENSATDYDLDRAYVGASETIDVSTETTAVGAFDATALTDFGLTLTDNADNLNQTFFVGSLLESATRTQVTAPVPSTGSGAQIAEEEADAKYYYGNLASGSDAHLPSKAANVDSTLTYDTYELVATNTRDISDPHSGQSSYQAKVLCAFLSSVADTSGKSQSNFEDVLTSLGVSVNTLF